MNNLLHVLDKGFVRLVSYVQPAPDFSLTDNPEYGGCAADVIVDSRRDWTGDLEIVRNARVSFDADWRTGEDEGKDGRLIGRMTEGRHSSPFEAMLFTFEVKAPIFVIRQWHRHRTWSYNEISGRYAPLQEEFYVPDPAVVGVQSQSNKQARDISSSLNDDVELGIHAFVQKLEEQGRIQYELYDDALDFGIPRELARLFLPLNTYTRMFATVDLHNLFHFLELRLHEHAQWEIRQYANALMQLIEPIVPIAVAEFKKNRLNKADTIAALRKELAEARKGEAASDRIAVHWQTEAAQYKADAERYRWLCAGNGYFLEEEGICGHSDEKDKADAAIDETRRLRGEAQKG